MGVAKKRPPNFKLLNPPDRNTQIKKKSGVKPNKKSRKFFFCFQFFQQKKFTEILKKTLKNNFW